METQCNQSQYLTLLNKNGAHNLSASQDNQANLSNSLICFEEICCRPRGAGFLSEMVKFIYPTSKPKMTETSTCTPVHVAYSPLASMNPQWSINLHDEYTSSNAQMPVEYIPPSLPTLCNHMCPMFHFGFDFLHSTQDTQHDLSCLASPKGEMTSSFSWTKFYQESHIKHFVFW